MVTSQTDRKKRSDCKILQLPDDVRLEVEDKILRCVRYTDISDWLREQGYEISKSAICEYAKDLNKSAQRIANDLEKTKAIIDCIEKNPDVDASKAAQAIMVSGIMQRISTAEDEFLEFPLDKAGRLLASFRRVDLAEKKLTLEQRKKIDLAFAELENRMMDAIKNDPALSPRLRSLLQEAKERMTTDE